MAATNALLAFGGMTQHCRRWGWRMFFLVSAQSSSRWRDRQFGVPRPFSPTTAGSSARVPWGFGTSQRNQFGFFLAVENPRNRRCRPLLAAQHSLEAFFHQLLPDPVNHGCGGLQRLDDPVVTPAFTVFGNVSHQQYPRLQQALRCALALSYQRFKLFAFLAAQPHNILLYRNPLRSHDRLRRLRRHGIDSQNPYPCKLIEAGD